MRNVITLDQKGLENRSPLKYIPGKMVFEYWSELYKTSSCKKMTEENLDQSSSENIALMQPFQKILHRQNVYAVIVIRSFACVNTDHLVYMNTVRLAQ